MKIYLRLLSYFPKYWLYLIGVFVCIILYSASQILLMPLVRNITSSVGSGSLSHFNNWMIDAVLLFMVQSLAKYGQSFWMAIVGNRVLMEVRVQIYKNLQVLSLDFYSKWRVGELISRTTNDTQFVQSTVSDIIAKILPNMITAIGVLIYLFKINTKFALSVFIIVPLYALFIAKIGVLLKSLTLRSQEKLANIVVILQESLSNIRLVKSFNMEKHEVRKYYSENTKNLRIQIKQVGIDELRDPVMSFFNVLILVFVLWIGGKEVINGSLSPDRLIEFLTGIALLPGPILAVSQGYISIQRSLGGAQRFFELIDMKPTVKEAKHPVKLENPLGKVSLRNVSFAYNEETILKNISLEVPAGQVIAIVGKSGSGKTTLVNLIPRFYDPQAGTVCIDDIPVQNFSFSSLRSHIGIVPQETMLFNGSIRQNIMYGNMSASEDEIVLAAKAANAHQYISLFPDGYETMVGDQGVRLSGGQRQRISIARALLRNPKILILDEATSALDSESERLVQEALERLMTNRTTFVIAHRLSTVINADKIIVLDSGTIVESGTHQELIAKSGIYKELYSNQLQA